MNIEIIPSCLTGTVSTPPSKSVAHRAILCAALSQKAVTLRHIELSDDITATIEAVQALGKEVRIDNDIIHMRKDIFVTNQKPVFIDCHESGSTARFLIPILAALGREATVTGRGQLPYRHFKPIIDVLNAHGIICDSEDILPLHILGQLKGDTFEIAGDISSQFITGLLLALPLLPNDSQIILTTYLESKPYLNITMQVLKNFGIHIEKKGDRFIVPGNKHYACSEYHVEGDYSNAAFFLAAGAIHGQLMTVCELSNTSPQGDRAIISLLERFGSYVHMGKDAVTVKGKCMQGIDIDAADIPDLVPILAVTAAFAKGKTCIRHVKRLRIKESDRLMAITEGLSKLGSDIQQSEDELVIIGKQKLAGGCTVSSFHDHRIAMALSIAASACEKPVMILDAECINKSYPNFYKDFQTIGGKTNVFNMG